MVVEGEAHVARKAGRGAGNILHGEGSRKAEEEAAAARRRVTCTTMRGRGMAEGL